MPWKLILPAVVITLAAGCLTSLTPGDTANSAGESPLKFKTTVIDKNEVGFEPGLIVTPDGAIFVCSPRGYPVGTDLWVSFDEGESFHYIGEKRNPSVPVIRSGGGDLGGGDCDMGVDAGGRVYLADYNFASVTVASSNDRGETWRGVPFSVAAPANDRPWVLGGEPDEVFVTVAQFQTQGYEERGLNAPPPGGIWVGRSTDGGLTFPQQVIAAGNEDRISLNSNLAMGDGNLYLIYAKKVGDGKLAIMVAVSEDRGASWEQRVVAEQAFYPGQCFSPVYVFPVIAADDEGGVYLAWILQNPETERTDLFLASSPDAGQTWNPPYILSSRPGTRATPWITAGEAGRVGIVWYETNVTALYTSDKTAGATITCSFKGMSDDAEWFLHYAFSDDATSPEPTFQEVLVQPEPIHTGQLGRPYEEVIQVKFAPDGRAAITYIADVPDGRARPMFALQSSGPVALNGLAASP